MTAPDAAYREQVQRDLARLVHTLSSHPVGLLCARAVLGLVSRWMEREFK